MPGAPSVAGILRRLRARGSRANREGMARFGIRVDRAFGVPVPAIRAMAKEIGTNHDLARKLWAAGNHEARLLAAFIEDPARITARQMEAWARDFDSWDVCDLCCSNAMDASPLAWKKALEWSRRPEEFVKRAGFVLMAALSVHDKQAPDARFRRFLPVIRREATDDRNFVKKAVNWALRQIGKRNRPLNRAAVATARGIAQIDSRAARWIASDALRELTNPRTLARLKG